ncbi:hypothetical protein BRC80_11740 [Halobacteriales archaeon QH_9_66_26]|nr:MAG: hypothetical protein BRC80_11740 [Halobacteriales archaeon QH_9_66_26]
MDVGRRGEHRVLSGDRLARFERDDLPDVTPEQPLVAELETALLLVGSPEQEPLVGVDRLDEDRPERRDRSREHLPAFRPAVRQGEFERTGIVRRHRGIEHSRPELDGRRCVGIPFVEPESAVCRNVVRRETGNEIHRLDRLAKPVGERIGTPLAGLDGGLDCLADGLRFDLLDRSDDHRPSGALLFALDGGLRVRRPHREHVAVVGTVGFRRDGEVLDAIAGGVAVRRGRRRVARCGRRRARGRVRCRR